MNFHDSLSNIPMLTTHQLLNVSVSLSSRKKMMLLFGKVLFVFFISSVSLVANDVDLCISNSKANTSDFLTGCTTWRRRWSFWSESFRITTRSLRGESGEQVLLQHVLPLTLTFMSSLIYTVCSWSSQSGCREHCSGPAQQLVQTFHTLTKVKVDLAHKLLTIPSTTSSALRQEAQFILTAENTELDLLSGSVSG